MAGLTIASAALLLGCVDAAEQPATAASVEQNCYDEGTCGEELRALTTFRNKCLASHTNSEACDENDRQWWIVKRRKDKFVQAREHVQEEQIAAEREEKEQERLKSRAEWEAERRAQMEKRGREEEAREELAKQKKAEEAERGRERAAEHRRLVELAHKNEFAIPVLSFQICEAKAEVQRLNGATAREVRLEQSSGVRDLRERRAIAESIEYQQAKIRELSDTIRKEYQGTPMACDTTRNQIETCQKVDDSCKEPWKTAGAIIDEGVQP